MQEGGDKKDYVTIPIRGDIELNYLFETVNYLRQLNWTQKTWKATPALMDKSGGSSKYVGQRFDPKYFDLIQDGWTHDHCEICFQTISDIEGFGYIDGYEAENEDWVCKECYNRFITPSDIQQIIKSLKTTTK